jgi:hypothetical protein
VINVFKGLTNSGSRIFCALHTLFLFFLFSLYHMPRIIIAHFGCLNNVLLDALDYEACSRCNGAV